MGCHVALVSVAYSDTPQGGNINAPQPLAIEQERQVVKGRHPLGDYFQWTPPKKAHAAQLGPFESMSAATTATLELTASGVTPVLAATDKAGSATVCVGRFHTIMELHEAQKELASFGISIRSSIRVDLGGKTSRYDNPLSTSLRLPAGGFLDIGADDRNVAKARLGVTLKDDGGLQPVESLVASAFRVPGSAPTTFTAEILKARIADFPDTSPLKLELIRCFSEREIASSKTLGLMARFTKPFMAGRMASSEDRYFAHMLRFADLEHEFSRDPLASYVLYKAVLDGVPGTSLRGDRGQRTRALVELTAISRELVGRQVGAYTGGCYWWKRYQDEGYAMPSRASAVIELILAENFKTDNMTALGANPALEDEFQTWCEAYHRKYPMCVRERLFMYNLQYGVACSSSIDRTDMCYAMTRDAHKLEPVPDSEQPQWAAERTPTLGGIVLAASRLAKSKGDAERMKEFDSMIDRTRLEVPTAILEPHLAFER